MTKIKFKRGDTFALDADVGQSIVGWSIRSQVRFGDQLVATLTITATDEEAGTYRITAGDTSDWPAKQLAWDIEYTNDDGVVISTETITIDCQADVTR